MGLEVVQIQETDQATATIVSLRMGRSDRAAAAAAAAVAAPPATEGSHQAISATQQQAVRTAAGEPEAAGLVGAAQAETQAAVAQSSGANGSLQSQPAREGTSPIPVLDHHGTVEVVLASAPPVAELAAEPLAAWHTLAALFRTRRPAAQSQLGGRAHLAAVRRYLPTHRPRVPPRAHDLVPHPPAGVNLPALAHPHRRGRHNKRHGRRARVVWREPDMHWNMVRRVLVVYRERAMQL